MTQPRIRVTFPTEFRAGGRSTRGKVTNVSAGGLFVHTEELPELGETIRLQLSPGTGRRLELSGMVWWTTDEQPAPRTGAERGFGLRFLDDYPAFEAFVESLR